MALRAVPDHPKFADLKQRLGLSKGATLGYLECVWHFAGRFTPQGNIGKYSDVAIEAWVEWEGEPGALMHEMAESKWLDRNEKFRLLIHDWPVNADELVHTTLARQSLTFADGTMPRAGRLNQKEREKFKVWTDALKGEPTVREMADLVSGKSASSQPVCLGDQPAVSLSDPEISQESACLSSSTACLPEASASAPKPEPVPEPEPAIQTKPFPPQELSPLSEAIERAAVNIFARHPVDRKNITLEDTKKRLKGIAKMINGAQAKIAKVQAVDAAHLQHSKSEKWTKDGGEFSNGLRNWLVGSMYDLPAPGSTGNEQAEAWPGQHRGRPNPGLIG